MKSIAYPHMVIFSNLVMGFSMMCLRIEKMIYRQMSGIIRMGK